MKVNKRMLILITAIVMIVACLAGCKDKAEEPEIIEPTYNKYGTEGPDAMKLLVRNNVGQNIKGVEIKLSTQDDTGYTENILTSGAAIAQDETVEIYHTPISESDSTNNEESITNADGEELVFNTYYDIRFTLVNDSVVTLYDFAYNDVSEDEAELLLEEDVIYMVYISESTKDEVNTKESQIARLSMIAEALAAEQAAAEAAAKEKAEKEAAEAAAAAAAEEYYYEPAPSSSPSQDTDGCLTDIVWN